MDVNVVVGETKPCSDLASRLAMVYNLLLQLAEKAETGHRIEKQASTGENLAATPAKTSEKLDIKNQIAPLYDPP